MEHSFSVRDYRPEDKQGINALKKAVDGAPFAEEVWKWKFETGPVRPAQIFVVDNKNNVVGLRTFVIERLKVMDEVFMAGLGVEVMVHPDFRRYRIASLMASEGFEIMGKKGVPVLLGFPNEVAYKVYSRTRPNWGPVCVIPLLVKPLNYDNIVSHYTRNGFLRLVSKTAAKLGWGILARESLPGPTGLDIQQIHSFDNRLDSFWQEASWAYDIGLVRDRAFLSWRFSKPQEQYSIFIASRDQKLSGYIVLKNDEMFNLRLGLIVDMLTLSQEDIACALISTALDHFREQKMDAMGCLMLHHSPYFKALRKAGFIAIPNKLTPKRVYFGVQVKPEVVSPSVIYDRRRWFLTFGDIDIA